jgi:hypothetical protein
MAIRQQIVAGRIDGWFKESHKNIFADIREKCFEFRGRDTQNYFCNIQYEVENYINFLKLH